MLPRPQAEQILSLRGHGMAMRAIARQVGCAHNTVIAYVHRRTTRGQKRTAHHALDDFVDYCCQRLADDPDLTTRTLFRELTTLGYRGSRTTFYRQWARHDVPCEIRARTRTRPSAQHPTTTFTVIAAGPPRPVPVRVCPVKGEPLISYLARVATSNHLAIDDLLNALPEWIHRNTARHHDRQRRCDPTRAATDALHHLSLLTGATEAALTHAIPAFATVLFSDHPTGPMRITTACRRCMATRGIRRPVPVQLPSHTRVCVRHGIWLSGSQQPQLDINICPEIITAQKHAWRLLRLLTPEQLMFAQVIGTGVVQASPTPRSRRRLELLHASNPDVAQTTLQHEVTTAAAYPDALALWRSRSYTSPSKIH